MRWAMVLMLAGAAAGAEPKPKADPKIGSLVEKLKSDDAAERTSAVKLLAFNGSAAAVAPLREAMSKEKVPEIAEAMKNAISKIATTFEYPPKVGQIGRLERGKASVSEVVDEKCLLINAFFTVEILTARGGRPVTQYESRRLSLLVRGVSTAGAADGLVFDLPQVFEVTGTEKAGGRTVLVIEPFDRTPAKP